MALTSIRSNDCALLLLMLQPTVYPAVYYQHRHKLDLLEHRSTVPGGQVRTLQLESSRIELVSYVSIERISKPIANLVGGSP